MARCREGLGRLQNTRHIAGMAQHHQRRARADGHGYRPRRQQPAGIRLQHPHPNLPRIVHGHQRAHHRVMLSVGNQHLIALMQKAPQGHVQRIGAVQAENHPFGLPDAQICRRLFPAAFHDPLPGDGTRMAAPARIARDFLHHPRHRLNHLRGLGKAGGRVIQINHGRSFLARSHPGPALSIYYMRKEVGA